MAPGARKRPNVTVKSNHKKVHGLDAGKKKTSSKLYIIIICFVICGLVGVIVYKNSLTVSDNVIKQKDKRTEKPSEKPTVKQSKKSKPQPDKYAAITNDFDKKLSKDINKAQKLLDQDRFDDALIKFEGLISRYSDSPRAVYGKAQALDKLSAVKQSNDFLTKAVETYGRVPDVKNCPDELKKLALRRQADRLTFLGRTRLASATLERLSDYFPRDFEILNELGVGYLMSGMNTNGRRTFEKVLKFNPNNNFAKVHLGFILKSALKYEESIPLLEAGINSGDAGTDHSRFYFHLGDAYNRLGRPDDAWRVYRAGATKGHFLSAWQRSMYNVNSLKGRPWWTPADTPYLKEFRKIEDNWKMIRDEGRAIMDLKSGGFLPEEENLKDTGDWLQFTLYQQGRKFHQNCKRTPKTCALFDTIRDASGCTRGQVKYSIMQPGTHIWPHCGPTNCRIRAHLGLVIPKNVHIRVANDTKTWQEGKIIIIDDSFDHEVWHNGTSFRLIFIIDFWHPELTAKQRHELTPI